MLGRALLLVSFACWLAACGSPTPCTDGLCYSPDTLTCAKGAACSVPPPKATGGTPKEFAISPALPEGLTLAANGGVGGTPAVAFPRQTYVVTGTLASGDTLEGRLAIVVTDDGVTAVSYSPDSVTCTVGVPCGLDGVSTEGGVPASFSVAPALPDGLVLNRALGTISGAPLGVSPTTSYTITASNGSGSATTAVSITVNDAAPGNLSYTGTPLVCTVGQSCQLGVPSSVGGHITGFSVSPPLPAGLELDGATGAIAGTPTAPSPGADHTVTATNSGGSTTAMVRITVNDVPPVGLAYSPSTVVCVKTNACALPAPTTSGGGAPTSFSAPCLPPGLAIDEGTGAISGAPTAVQPATACTVTARNSGGSTTADVTITVNDLPPAGLTYTPNVLSCTEGTPCGLAAPTNTGGTITTFSVQPALPTGLLLDPATGAISGTPRFAVSGAGFIVTGSNTGGSTTATITVTIAQAAPTALTYASGLVCQRTVPCSAPPPTPTGGSPTSYTIAPALPAGLAIDAATGAIGGTASSLSGATIYTVTGTNPLGSATGTINVRVNELAPANLVYATSAVSCAIDTPCPIAAPTCGGGPVASYSISPSLPTGMSLSNTTGEITGTPTVAIAARNFTVTATNSGGSTTAVINLVVHDYPPRGLAYSPSSVVCGRGAVCSLGPPTSDGGVILSYAVAPSLPSGLSLGSSTGTVSGRASVVSPVTTYTVTGSNAEGATTATFDLSVIEVPPSGLSYDPGLSCRPNQNCNITATSTGGPITSYAISPAPPSWLTFDTATGSASGTPTAPMTPVTYTVTGTNALGSTTAPLSVGVFAPMGDYAAQGLSFRARRFSGIGIDPTTPSAMYAVDVFGNAFGSTNAGASWTFLCVSRSTSPGQTYYGNVLVSPTGAAFTNDHTTVDRITDRGGSACPQLSRYIWATYETDTWFAFTPSGRIYNWDTRTGLSFSNDDGVTWTDVPGSAPSLFRSLGVDPFDPTRVLSVHQQWNASPNGIVLGPNTSLSTAYHDYSNPVLFDPAHRGFIFLGRSGVYSRDGGATWTRDAAFAVWAFDATGAGYRLENLSGAVRLRKAPDLTVTAPVWSTISTFSETSMPSESDLKVSGTNVIALVGPSVYVSTDQGVTFGPALSLPYSTPTARADAVAASGSVVYLAGQENVFRSANDGATWTLSPETVPLSARIHLSATNPSRAYLRSEAYSGTYVGTLLSTADGFQSVVRSTAGNGWYSWASAFAVSAVDDAQAYALGQSAAKKTIDASTTWTTVSVTNAPGNWFVWYPGYAAEVSPWTADQVFYTDTSAGQLYVYDHSAVTNTTLTGALPFSDVAGLELVRTGTSSFALRVVSRGGKLAQSSDGLTFTTVNAYGGLTTTSARILRTLAGNPNVVATASLNGNAAAISWNGGASWLPLAGTCSSIRDLAFISGHLLIACRNAPLRDQPLP